MSKRKKQKRIFGSKHTGYVTGEGVACTAAPESEDIGTVGKPVPKSSLPDKQETPEDVRVRELKDEVHAEAACIEAEKQREEVALAQAPAQDQHALDDMHSDNEGKSRADKSTINHSRGASKKNAQMTRFEGRYAHLGEASSNWGDKLRKENRNSDGPRSLEHDRSLERDPYEEIAGEVTVYAREPQEATEYDDLINWKALLARESPLYSRAFSFCNAKNVLELGSGCGQRSVMFAEWGFDVIGVDESRVNVDKSRQLAERHHLNIGESGGVVRFATNDFESISDILGGEQVDAIVCANDVLSSVESLDQLRRLLHEVSEMLVPSGVIVLELVNNTHYIQQKIRSTVPEVFDTQEGTKVFFRVMDYPAGSTTFSSDTIALSRGVTGEWSAQSSRKRHLFISSAGIAHELFDAGFDIQEISGDYSGRELQQYSDERIVIIASRKRHRTI